MSPFHRIFSRAMNHRQQRRRPAKRTRLGLGSRSSLHLEQLEHRSMLSAAPPSQLELPTQAAVAAFAHVPAMLQNPHGNLDWSSGTVGLLPSQIRHAYGIDQLQLTSGGAADGTGQTIAIIDPFDDPNIKTDLDTFDGGVSIDGGGETLLQEYGSASSFFTQVAPFGTPQADPNHGQEISLDVEWAHAIAPGAKIILVEALTDGNSIDLQDLLNAVYWATEQSAVTSVSMSWGFSEFSGESGADSYFVTPRGHQGITFVAATGDSGAPAAYPAYSPNVVAVGGTTLTIDNSNNWENETGWSHSGGGISTQEREPNFQEAVVNQSGRTAPDVAFDADPNSGVAVADTDGFALPDPTPWESLGGTSLGAPVWSALVAIANQERAAAGLASLDGPSQTLPLLYSMPSSSFHDVTSGNNGYPALTGYDLVTGRGTPVAQSIVPNLAAALSPTTEQTVSGTSTPNVLNNGVQTLFVVGSNGTVRDDQFNETTHFASGQTVLDPNTLFPSGASITVYNDGESLNLFAVGSDGYLKWAKQVNGGTWSTFGTFTSSVSFNPGSELVGFALPGSFNLFGVNSNGYIEDAQYSSSTNSWTFTSFSNMLYFNPGTPLAIYESQGLIRLYGVLPAGTVGLEQYSGSWGGSVLGGSANALFRAGAPLAIYEDSTGLVNLFGVNENGDIGDVQYTTSGWVGWYLSASSANFAPGTPLGIYENSSGLIDLFGVNRNGSVVYVQHMSNWGSPTAISDPLGAYAVNSGVGTQVTVSNVNGILDVFGLGASGHLLDEQLVSSWDEYDLD